MAMNAAPAAARVAEPMPWQRERWQRLIQLQDSGRLPHALLISGPHGIGKQPLVEALIARTLCRNPGEVACGECHGCRMLAAGYHPDLISVAPVEKSRQIRIDAIRQVNGFVSQTAQQGGYRVIRIEPAEAMNVAASNALLKSLEEPGQRTLFVLVSDIASRLLPTLRSGSGCGSLAGYRCSPRSWPVPRRASCARNCVSCSTRWCVAASRWERQRDSMPSRSIAYSGMASPGSRI